MKLTALLLLPFLAGSLVGCNDVPKRWHSVIPEETALDDGSCRNDLDCDTTTQSCANPDFQSCEGDCVQPPIDCVEDGGCEPGEVCHSFVVACSCAGYGYTCKLGCTTDESCGPEESCDENSGHCLPTSCEDNYVCAPGTSCIGGGGPEHGCQRDICTQDSDCSDGLYCVDHGCYSDLGTCQTSNDTATP